MLEPKRVFVQFMQGHLFLLFWALVSSCSSYNDVDYQSYQQTVETTAILNVNVLSADGERILANQNVLLDNGVIIQVSQSEFDLEGVKVIDGSGKYLIPGLVDSHAHLQKSPNDLLVYAAHGVTYIREMSGDKQHLAWQREVQKGRIAPKIEVFSQKIASEGGIWGKIRNLFWTRINISSKEQADALVNKLVEQGYKGAKISSDINKPMYLAITQAAKRKELAVVGHIPQSITFNDFWTSGQNELAHIEELTKTLNNEFGWYTSHTADEFLNYVKNRRDEVALKLKQQHISVGTTLWFMESLPKQVVELDSFIESLDLTYGNPARVSEWMPGENHLELSIEKIAEPKTSREYKIYWDTYVEAIHIMLQALVKHDVTLLVGTDSMTSLVIPGVSMHQELDSLVKAGMTNAQALRSATLIPGEWMQANIGKISEGYAADLVLLDDNPLQNIKHTRNIHSVILAGKVLDKSTIKHILQSVRHAYGHDSKD